MTTHAPETMRSAQVRFDTQIFRMQRRGGISRYFVELIKSLDTIDAHVSAPFPATWTTNEHAIEAGLAHRYPEFLHPKRFKNRSKRVQRLTQRAFDAATSSTLLPQKKSVYHPTYYVRELERRERAPMVVTLVDMIPELLPELFAKNPHRDKLWYLQHADAIISISKSTADDLKQLHPEIAAQVYVIPLGVDAKFYSNIETEPEYFPQPWCLFVGGRGGYKDFDVLLQSLKAPSLSDLHLVAAGNPASPQELKRVEELRLSHRVSFVTADDARLRNLYRSCDVFVFPSRYEGFGLPTLEALASGAPVLLADSSSHPEVGGSACRYFEPEGAEALAHGLGQILYDSDLQTRMRLEAPVHAAKFPWSRTAEMTADVYRNVAGGAVR